MERTVPSSESNASRELAAFECLEMLEGERAISIQLIEEAERLMTTVMRRLDTAAQLELTDIVHRERCRAHLTSLRAFIGGGFHLDTKES